MTRENAPGAGAADTIRVMVVDDSAVIRGLTTRALESDPAIKVISSLSNGKLAVEKLARDPVDVVVLDIEMPVMDGLTALPLMLKACPNVRVIMSSTLTQRNADVSITAMRAGAADYVPKPTNSAGLSADDFKNELIRKVKSLAANRQAPAAGQRTPASTAPVGAPAGANEKIALLPPSRMRPKLLAIGSSTGGPQALFKFMEALDRAINVPVVITQHMPPMFTKILAEHITKGTAWPCAEGSTGDILQPGKAYLAPGDHHMLLRADGGQVRLELNQDPPENFCRPAVDPMLRSAVDTFGARILVTILTGMGADGMRGSKVVVDAGGSVVAQDEKTSVVWGMPGAVAREGLCSAVLPIDQMGSHVSNRFKDGLP